MIDLTGEIQKTIDSVASENVAQYGKTAVIQKLTHILRMTATFMEQEDSGTCRSPIRTETLRRGDVFIAKVIGGKIRPWIVLRVGASGVSAIPMSSGDFFPGAIEAQCRYWPGIFIGNAIAGFEYDVACKEVTRPYTNLQHLADIERDLAASHGMTLAPPRKIKTMADVLERARA